jgi:perosamine synthetase
VVSGTGLILSMLRLNVPFTGDDEVREIAAVLESGYLTQGPKGVEFEEAVKAVTGSRHGFAMSSATTALHLSLAVLGIGPGDEVAVSDFTYPASGNVIIQQGAVPVCIDVLPDSYAMDAADLEQRITSRTRAVMVVHPFGLSADMDAILAVCEKHGLPVIEDAACALGAEYRGRPCGSIGRLGCFSFHPRKSITTGEGGMIMTDDDTLADKIRLLRSHGGRRGDYALLFEEAGYNYRLSDVLAALGVAQMRRLQWLLDGKRERAAQLRARLEGIAGLKLPVEPSDCRHTWQSFVCVLDSNFNQAAVIGSIRECGVECTLGTYAMHSQPAFQKRFGYRAGDLPVSWRLQQQTLTLPLYPQMTENDLDLVASAVRGALS